MPHGHDPYDGMAQAGWLLPKRVWVQGDHLYWTPTSRSGQPRPGATTAGREVLERFTALHTSTDEDIEGFAKELGPLHLCGQHLLPMTHVPFRLLPVLGDEHPICRPAGGAIGHNGEPLSRWRELSQQGAAMLRIAALLASGDEPVAEEWVPLADLLTGVNLPKVRSMTVEEQRALLAEAVQAWLDLGDVMVKYTWSGQTPVITFGSNSLFGALAIQMALTVGKAKGLVICDECRRAYAPLRTPAPGRPRRCPSKGCRVLGAKRAWARRNREASG